jgi:hypothetical protein
MLVVDGVISRSDIISLGRKVEADGITLRLRL